MSDNYLSYSQLQTFLGCPYKHNLHYTRGIRPRVDGVPLVKGRLVHAGLESAILDMGNAVAVADARILEEYRIWLETLAVGPDGRTPEMLEEWQQTVQDSRTITYNTIRHMGLDGTRWETVYLGDEPLVEYHLIRKFPSFRRYHGFHGYPDWVAKDRESGFVWLIDWKTRKQIQDDDYWEMDRQMPIYQYLLNTEYDLKIAGAAYVQIRSEPPNEPKRKKDGEFSRAAQKTDWPTYKSAVVACGKNPDDFLDMKPKLSTFYKTTNIYRTHDYCGKVWEDFSKIIDLLESTGEPITHRHLGNMMCRSCQYRDHCMGELRGDDIDWMMKTQYMHKDEKPLTPEGVEISEDD